MTGALEAGGTKMVMALGEKDGTIYEKKSIPTLTPEETMPEMIAFFRQAGVTSLGIACFGPLNLRTGMITDTPKPGWKDYPIKAEFEKALGVPAGIDTDVNGAALAEYSMGAGRGRSSLLYVTIGTGIGGGFVSEGRALHGLQHPEMGHMQLAASPDDPMPHGVCPYHRGCLEGLAAGPSIQKRWGVSAKELPLIHPAWDVEAEYLSQLCLNAVMMLSPEVIVLGGGVMQRKHLFEKVRAKTLAKVNGYIRSESLTEKGIADYIVEPGLGVNSGITGALLLAPCV